MSIGLETFRRLAPLGLELRDAATGRRVGDGLVVSVAPAGRPQRVVIARANPSGIWVAHDLPGLGDWSHGGDEPDPRPEFDIRISDPAGRFLPCRLRLPLPQNGLAQPACRADIPLFSAPTRAVPGWAVVRAELRHLQGDAAAAWAIVRVHHGGETLALGQADGQGRLLLAFPYPEPALGNAPLADTVWNLSFGARSQGGPAADEPPELCQALGQPVAHFVRAFAPLDLTPALTAELRPGTELRLVSPGRAHLYISP